MPASIEPEMLGAGAAGLAKLNGRLVQPPGPRNPLGRIGLEASQGVFLHGTSEPRLFARESRTLSHSCGRVERITERAGWILGRSPEELQAAIATGRPQELTPPEAVRVVLTHLTAWPDEEGRLVLHADLYGLDRPGSQPRRVLAAPARREPPRAQVVVVEPGL